MKHTLYFLLAVSFLISSNNIAANGLPKVPSLDELFTITTHNVEVKEMDETSLNLHSSQDAYSVKLVPNKKGNVIFSITGIGCRSTAKFSNLSFEVKITGFRDEILVYPAFSLDDINDDITVHHNVLSFTRIEGSIPVWFNQPVDSINLEYSNSLSVGMNQYLRIHDLEVVESVDVSSNPLLSPCMDNDILIAVDGSSSIDKNERTLIGRELGKFAKTSSKKDNFSSLCLIEFGSDIKSIVTSRDKKTLARALSNYRKGRNNKKKTSCWTNWSAAFDEAIQRKPELFIFVTDGWSNWEGTNPSSFTSVYSKLIAKCNLLKENGTRLLFITSDLDTRNHSKSILNEFLNSEQTVEVNEKSLVAGMNLSEVDLISLKGFSKMGELNIASILVCTQPAEIVVFENTTKESIDFSEQQ